MKKLSLLLFGLIISAFAFSQTLHTGTISADETWAAAGNPHLVTGNIIISDGVTVTIDAGVLVQFVGNRRIVVNGALSANGINGNPITMTSSSLTPAAGDWRFVNFDGADAGSNLTYVNMSYGGSANATVLVKNSANNVSISNCSISHSANRGIRLSNNVANPSISDCIFDNCADMPIYTYADRVKDITGTNTFTNNVTNAIFVRSQPITTGTWGDHGVYYIFDGNSTVGPGETLTLEAGVELRFNASDRLQIQGALIADGTDGNRIKFTSNQTVPAKGDWNNLYFFGASASSVSYCDFEYGGSGTSTVEVRNCGTNVNFDNISISNSASDGLRATNTSLPLISNFTGTDCDDYPMYVLSDGVSSLSGTVTLSGNMPDAIRVQTGTVTTSTWMNFGHPYVITGGALTVGDGETLTLEPGITIKINGTNRINVQGTLIADGDAANHITFTSNEAVPAQGDWNEVYFNEADAGCILDYCDITYGGGNNGGVYLNNTTNTVSITNCLISNSLLNGIYYRTNSSALISDCSITDGGDYAIRTGANKVKDITGTMTITGNTNNAIRVDAENIFSGTWLDHGVPYVVTGDLNQLDANTLIINPGVELQFNADTRLRIYGTLIANGTDADHIVFTANHTTPTAGFWERLFFDGADFGTSLSYCDIMYGGNTQGGVDVNNSGSNVSFTNCTVSNSGLVGVMIRNGSHPTFTNSAIINNTNEGVYIAGNSTATFGASEAEWNDLYGNGTYELRNGTADIDAKYIYWGSTACNSIGSLIYDINDNAGLGEVDYIPFLNSSHVMPDLATTWTGAVDSDWDTDGNWDNNTPCGNSDVTIPGSPASGNFPEIDSDASCFDLTLEAGSELEVFSGILLDVRGDALLEADATGTASLVENFGIQVAGSTTSEFYISEDRWHFVSAPMTGQTANPFFGIYLQNHDELTNTYTNIVDETTPMNVGQGYQAWSYSTSTGNQTVQFTGGTLNSGTVFLPVTNAGSGWNLVGNPFASAVDWDDLSWIKNEIGGTVWVHDGTSNWRTWNGSTGDLTDGIIPAMQAFFVKANPSPASVALAVSSGARTHGVDPYKTSSVQETLALTINGNGHYDKIFVGFNEEATNEYDFMFDGDKLYGIEEAPQMFTYIGETIMSVNILNNISEELVVPMGLDVGADEEYTIIAQDLASFGADVDIYLEDLQEDVMINLKQQGDYTFNAATGDETHRFNIHFFKSSELDETIPEASIYIYSNDNNVFVKNMGAELDNAQLEVYNISGQKVYTDNLQDIPLNKVDLNLKSGYYIVKVISNGAINSEKVFIK